MGVGGGVGASAAVLIMAVLTVVLFTPVLLTVIVLTVVVRVEARAAVWVVVWDR